MEGRSWVRGDLKRKGKVLVDYEVAEDDEERSKTPAVGFSVLCESGRRRKEV